MKSLGQIISLALLLSIPAAAFAWGVILPTIGLLYTFGALS